MKAFVSTIDIPPQKELTVQYIPPQGRRRPRVRVEYTSEIGAQRQAQEAAFRFSITDDERRLIQWYLEDYLTYPWGEFQNRAQRAEALMERLGKELFDVVFGTREIGTLYSHVADDLSNTRIIIHAADQEGIALPWELMRDSTLGAYGYLARLAHALRPQPAGPQIPATTNTIRRHFQHLDGHLSARGATGGRGIPVSGPPPA